MDPENTADADGIPILHPEDRKFSSSKDDEQVTPENVGFDPYDTASLFVRKITSEEEQARPQASDEDHSR